MLNNGDIVVVLRETTSIADLSLQLQAATNNFLNQVKEASGCFNQVDLELVLRAQATKSRSLGDPKLEHSEAGTQASSDFDESRHPSLSAFDVVKSACASQVGSSRVSSTETSPSPYHSSDDSLSPVPNDEDRSMSPASTTTSFSSIDLLSPNPDLSLTPIKTSHAASQTSCIPGSSYSLSTISDTDALQVEPSITELDEQDDAGNEISHTNRPSISSRQAHNGNTARNNLLISSSEAITTPCTSSSRSSHVRDSKRRSCELTKEARIKRARTSDCAQALPMISHHIGQQAIPQNVFDAFRNVAVDDGQLSLLCEAWTDSTYPRMKLADHSRFRTLQLIMSVATPECLSIYIHKTASVLSAPDVDENIQEMQHSIGDIRRLSKRKNYFITQLREMYIRLYSEHQAKIEDKRKELETQRKIAKKERRRSGTFYSGGQNGRKAMDIIMDEYALALDKDDFQDLKIYLHAGNILATLVDGLQTSTALRLLPCQTVRTRMPITFTTVEKSHWLRSDMIGSNEYDDMSSTQSRFFADWVLKLRPKLKVLKVAKMNMMTHLITNDGHLEKLREWNLLPLDCDEFLEFLCE